MSKRSGKFYRKNEAEVMKQLGLEPTPNSGSGWVVKEDGQNEDVICQLKSTDAKSIRIDQKDIETLEYNALVSHKVPVFAIQFLNTNEVFLLIRPENLQDVSGLIVNKKPINNRSEFLGLETQASEVQGGKSEIDLKPKGDCKSVIKSSGKVREAYMREHDKRYDKPKRSAK